MTSNEIRERINNDIMSINIEIEFWEQKLNDETYTYVNEARECIISLLKTKERNYDLLIRLDELEK